MVTENTLTCLHNSVDVNTVNLFESCIDKFMLNPDIEYDFTADRLSNQALLVLGHMCSQNLMQICLSSPEMKLPFLACQYLLPVLICTK